MPTDTVADVDAVVDLPIVIDLGQVDKLDLLNELDDRGIYIKELVEYSDQELIDELDARGIHTGDDAVSTKDWQQLFELLRQGHIHQVLERVRAHVQNVTGRIL